MSVRLSPRQVWARALVATCFFSVVCLLEANSDRLFPRQDAQKKTFACAINCMDGRVQDVVKQYMQKNYGVAYVDVVTEAGPSKILAAKPSSEAQKAVVDNIKKRIDVSITHHQAKVVVIAAHGGCVGNSAGKEAQIRHLQEARETVRSFGFKEVEIILLWIEDDWKTVVRVD